MIARALGSFSRTVRARNVIAMLEMVGAERILEWAGIAEAGGGYAKADVLGKNARCNVDGERCHIWIHWNPTLLGTCDVGRIIEQPLPVQGD